MDVRCHGEGVGGVCGGEPLLPLPLLSFAACRSWSSWKGSPSCRRSLQVDLSPCGVLPLQTVNVEFLEVCPNAATSSGLQAHGGQSKAESRGAVGRPWPVPGSGCSVAAVMLCT